MKTYVNNGGAHIGTDGKQTRHGETITTNEDLVQKFPNKFSLVVAPAVAEDVLVAVAPVAAQEAVVLGETPRLSGRVDVTEEFPLAIEVDLVVEKDKKGWYVIDDGEVLNEKPLKKSSVVGFIKKFND